MNWMYVKCRWGHVYDLPCRPLSHKRPRALQATPSRSQHSEGKRCIRDTWGNIGHHTVLILKSHLGMNSHWNFNRSRSDFFLVSRSGTLGAKKEQILLASHERKNQLVLAMWRNLRLATPFTPLFFNSCWRCVKKMCSTLQRHSPLT